jgi:hypothetical protein
MPPIAFPRRFAAIALGESLHDPKGGVRGKHQAPQVVGYLGYSGRDDKARESSPRPITAVRVILFDYLIGERQQQSAERASLGDDP